MRSVGVFTDTFEGTVSPWLLFKCHSKIHHKCCVKKFHFFELQKKYLIAHTTAVIYHVLDISSAVWVLVLSVLLGGKNRFWLVWLINFFVEMVENDGQRPLIFIVNSTLFKYIYIHMWKGGPRGYPCKRSANWSLKIFKNYEKMREKIIIAGTNGDHFTFLGSCPPTPPLSQH